MDLNVLKLIDLNCTFYCCSEGKPMNRNKKKLQVNFFREIQTNIMFAKVYSNAIMNYDTAASGFTHFFMLILELIVR